MDSSATINFAIVRGTKEGAFVDLLPNTPEFTYLACTMHLALTMLLNDVEYGGGMINLIVRYHAFALPERKTGYPWKDGHHGCLPPAETRNKFLNMVRATPPMVVVDEGLADSDALSYTTRVATGDFDPRRQVIHVNAKVFDLKALP